MEQQAPEYTQSTDDALRTCRVVAIAPRSKCRFGAFTARTERIVDKDLPKAFRFCRTPSTPHGQKQTIPTSPLTMVGGDAEALRHAYHYGTLLVDLEKCRPLDLLPERNATTGTSRLSGHHAVQWVSRDRAGVYAKGVTRGAP